MDDQNKNLILATALSFLVILVWFVVFPPEEQAPVLPNAAVDDQIATPLAEDGTAATPTISVTPAQTREAALGKDTRVAIETPRLKGSLSLKGGRIDDLALSDYNVELNDPSEKVTLLSPAGSPQPYYTLHGWAPTASMDPNAVPNVSTPWELEVGTTLTPSSPITLKWDNGAGLIFRRAITVDKDFLFTITQSVENTTSAPVRMAPYGIIARHGEPDVVGFYILHEGVVRASDGEIQEIDYDDMPDQTVDASERAAVDKIDVLEDGWVGFTDKYWMTTLLPEPGQKFTSVSKYTTSNDTYQTDMRLPIMEVAAGGTSQIKTSLFAGAKEYDVIKQYQNELGFKQYVDSIDWGWFFFLTKPMFQLLHWLHGVIGNMGWAIIGLTLIIKAILFPLAYKSYVSMARMKELQPEMAAMKERIGDDRQKMQQEMMKLYKEKKVNPAAGCLPILLQIPIFFSLYKVIFVTIELRHEPFIWWIKDLSAPDPTSWMNLFGLLPYDVSWAPLLISIGILPILMGITMWLQQKLNPAPTDATQAMIFAWMPWVFMFMLGGFASGLVLYWVANNTITFIQQYTIMRSQGVDMDLMGNIKSGFKRKKTVKKE